MDSVSPSAAAVGLAATADAAYLPNDISLLFRPSSAASASSQGDAEVPVESLTAVLLQVRHRCDVNLNSHDTFFATIFLLCSQSAPMLRSHGCFSLCFSALQVICLLHSLGLVSSRCLQLPLQKLLERLPEMPVCKALRAPFRPRESRLHLRRWSVLHNLNPAIIL